jgi:hypothetical protein
MATTVRERRGIKHPKPKVTTTYETVRILLDQQGGGPLSLGPGWTMYAVPSSGAPDSPPFYMVGHKPLEGTQSDLWFCHCKQFRFRGVPGKDCEHIKQARGD